MTLLLRLAVLALASGLVTACQAPPPTVSIDNDDIGGQVRADPFAK